MTTKVKFTRNKRWGAGSYRVSIAEIKQTLDKEGNPKINKNGDGGLDVVFKKEDGLKFTSTFWLGEKTQWLLDLLLKAIKVDNSQEEVDAAEAYGKELWIFIADEYLVHEGQELCDENGEVIIRDKLTARFAEVYGDHRPAVNGDPIYNDGVASASFLIKTPASLVLGKTRADEILARMNGSIEEDVVEDPDNDVQDAPF